MFDSVEDGSVELCLCSLSFSNIYYIMRPKYGKKKTLEGLTELSQTLTVLPVDEAVIADALASEFTDFEDAIQYYSALAYSESGNEIGGIITRNGKDFRLSEIAVVSPTDFL